MVYANVNKIHVKRLNRNGGILGFLSHRIRPVRDIKKEDVGGTTGCPSVGTGRPTPDRGDMGGGRGPSGGGTIAVVNVTLGVW